MPILARNRKRYPDDWQFIREQVRLRSGGRCECECECGMRHDTVDGRCSAVHGRQRVVLTVAHLDHTPENRDLRQLRDFCQGCHNRYDIPHRVKTRRESARLRLEASGQQTLFDAATKAVIARRR